jgi:hypothetical protein
VFWQSGLYPLSTLLDLQHPGDDWKCGHFCVVKIHTKYILIILQLRWNAIGKVKGGRRDTFMFHARPNPLWVVKWGDIVGSCSCVLCVHTQVQISLCDMKMSPGHLRPHPVVCSVVPTSWRATCRISSFWCLIRGMMRKHGWIKTTRFKTENTKFSRNFPTPYLDNAFNGVGRFLQSFSFCESGDQ